MKSLKVCLVFLALWVGTVVAADDKPQRIVSLTLGTDEILLSLVPPNRIAAVTSYALDPGISNVFEQAKAVSNTLKASSLEIVVALQPDLILAASYTPADVVAQLKNMGFKVLTLTRFSSIKDIRANILAIGEAVHEPEKAESIVAHMEHRLARVANALKHVPRRPGLLSFDLEGWTAGKETTFDEIVRRAGGTNLAAKAGLHGHPKISLEKVIEIDPEIIILNGWHPDDAANRNQTLIRHPALQSVSAVKTGQVFQIPGKQLTAVSHFIALGVEKMAQKLHPARFAAKDRAP